jgi:hypothetical protein
MPGPFSSSHSVEDALELGRRLGIEVRQVDIGPIFAASLSVFRQLFGEKSDYGVAQQNIQARIRGAILMAISNAENRLVLATGNKSELSVGYCTLYGDLVGGLAVLGDVLKRDVYALARHANRDGSRIPRGSIEKPPSAELAPDQLDSDDLPTYDILDAILEQAIEGRGGVDGIAPPPGAVEVYARPQGGRAEGFRVGRLAWGVQFHPEVDQDALDGWYREWSGVLAPAGVAEADIRAQDARHLPGQAALAAAIFGAFARVVHQRGIVEPGAGS